MYVIILNLTKSNGVSKLLVFTPKMNQINNFSIIMRVKVIKSFFIINFIYIGKIKDPKKHVFKQLKKIADFIILRIGRYFHTREEIVGNVSNKRDQHQDRPQNENNAGRNGLKVGNVSQNVWQSGFHTQKKENNNLL